MINTLLLDKKVYKSAIKNTEFMNMMEGNGEDKPSNDEEKLLFAATYYGWMMCDYGAAWESYL